MDFKPRSHRMVATVLATAAALACVTAAPADSPDPGGAAYPEDTADGRHALLGEVVSFRGKALSGTRMAVQLHQDGSWVTVARATAGRSGRYVASWRTDRAGVFKVRTVTAGSAKVRASAVGSSEQMTVYRRAVATWYGKGWEGRRTACGQRISRTIMGVAHKTLPCGTQVSFYYEGRTVTVPVIDRGPYGRGISWDLTTAAAEQLDFIATGKGTVGAVIVGR
jgi:rare lipoprotein A (peptidoglycan hydrolase)